MSQLVKPRAATVILAGFAAGTLSTLAQMVLWAAAGRDAWALLLRDAGLTAALMLGESADSPSPGLDAGIMLAATAIHFALSISYAALLLPAAKRLNLMPSLLAGAGVGGSLYFVNLHGFTYMFPWFTQARGGTTLVAHLVFGMVVMLTYRWLGIRTGPLGAVVLLGWLIVGGIAHPDPAQAAPPPEYPTRWEMPPGNPVELETAGFAKLLCSVVFLMGRSLEAAIMEDGSFVKPPEARRSAQAAKVDWKARSVSLTLANGVTRTAREFADQGCVILPRGITPITITSIPARSMPSAGR